MGVFAEHQHPFDPYIHKRHYEGHQKIAESLAMYYIRDMGIWQEKLITVV